MKKIYAAHSLRAMLTAMAGAFVVLFAIEARGQFKPAAIGPPGPPQLFPWGSSNILTAFAVTNTYLLSDSVSGQSSPGVENSQQSGGAYIGPNTFSSKADIDTAFQEVLAFSLNQALTNTSMPVNKNLPVLVVGSGYNDYYPPTSISSAFTIPYNTPVSFVNSNGTWILPDLSGIKLALTPMLLFYVPNLEWARIEVYSTTNLATPFTVVDSRDSSSNTVTNNVDLVNQAFTVTTSYLASGTNGPYRLKVSFLTSQGFTIVDGTGVQRAETPVVLSLAKVGLAAHISIRGGDPGRVFVLQKSTDMKTWAQFGNPYTVGTNGWSLTVNDTGGPTPQVIGPPPAPSAFYRAMMVNQVPQ